MFPGVPGGVAQPPAPPPAVDEATRDAALAVLTKRDPNLTVIRDARGRPELLIGDLADPAGRDLAEAARRFIKQHAEALGIATKEREFSKIDEQDGNPVRMVRFQPMRGQMPIMGAEVQVVFDRDGRVIAFCGDDTASALAPGAFGISIPPTPGGGGGRLPPFPPGPLPGPPGPGPIPPAPTGAPEPIPGGFESPPIKANFAAALAKVGPEARLRGSSSIRTVLVPKDGKLALRAIADCETENPPGTWRFSFHEDGEVEDVKPIHAGVSGKVYDGYPAMNVTEVSLTDLASDRVLDGRHVKTAQGDNERAHPTDGRYDFHPEPEALRTAGRQLGMRLFNPDFLEVQVYHHISRAHAMVRAYGSDALDSPVQVEVLTPYAKTLMNNAFYQPGRHAIEFVSLSAFHPAADASVIYHEYGHAVFDKLSGAGEPVSFGPRPALEESACNEGFADAFSGLLTGSPIEGELFAKGVKSTPRDARNSVALGPNQPTESHALGCVFSGLAWEVRETAGDPAARKLLLGSAQLAPRPRGFRAMVMGMLIADRLFEGGKHAGLIRSAARRRGIVL